MKKRPQKSKIFNSVNIILIALLFVELVFIINEGGLTGNQVKSVIENNLGKSSSSVNTLISNSQDRYSLELDIPDYLSENLRHPQRFFSGRKIKIVDKSNKNYFPFSIILTKRDSTTKEILSKEIIGATKSKENGEGGFVVEIPKDTVSGYYTFDFKIKKDKVIR
ncbi:hypothetical protein HY212_04880 [Candidatus Pacearchaeota archaeon]|nr:hypothetical protein [Candidatus Pacearchaeota archaeon]